MLEIDKNAFSKATITFSKETLKKRR